MLNDGVKDLKTLIRTPSQTVRVDQTRKQARGNHQRFCLVVVQRISSAVTALSQRRFRQEPARPRRSRGCAGTSDDDRSSLSHFEVKDHFTRSSESGKVSDLLCSVRQRSLSDMRMDPLRLALCFLIACSSLVANAAYAKAAVREFDKVIALDRDRRIALHCRGGGTFTVLLETGDGGRRAHMALLFDALSKRYRVCDYDRRNGGKSSAAPTPRKADDLSSDAFDALAASGEHGPYLLFGTSMGGLLARSYAATRPIMGFVTSNQPGTTREWALRAHPVMSPSERNADDAWAAGDNDEHIDVRDVSRTIDAAPPPMVPYVIMISTEQFQCPATGVCGQLYQAFVGGSQQAASAGPRGRFQLLDGNHDLYVTNLDQVIRAIDAVAAAATHHN